MDNLPTAQVRLREDGGRMVKTYERGYPVGFKAAPEDGGPEAHYLHNHARFTILYNRDPETDLSRIVGFEVEPASVKHRYKNRWDPVNPQLETCNAERHPLESLVGAPQAVEEGEEVVFTYDVAFKASDIRWASRWDTYLQMSDDNIHWFSIVNSLMIVLFLSGMVAMIMVRTLRRDISQYNELESAEEAAEESGWKMVHGDVFRSPTYAGALACAAGTGVQLLGMASITMCFAVLGFLSPANRGGLMTAMLLLFVLMGVAAGYASARLFKTFGLTKWRQMTLHTALAYPGFCFVIFFTLNLLIWGQRSSGAVPFGTLIALTALWFGISVPLVFVGSYFGFKRAAPDAPVRTNKIPRQVPPQPWYMAPAFSVLVGGILPFGAVFIELFFILTSMWCVACVNGVCLALASSRTACRLHQVYYIFGVLFVVFGILVVTCAEITIVLCYFQLCSEDYRWWWRAFFTSGSSALYMFLYSAFYFVTKLEITKLVSTLMYFGEARQRASARASPSLAPLSGYMLILSVSFFLMTGAQTPVGAPHAPRSRIALLRRHCGLPGLLAVRARDLWQREDRLNESGGVARWGSRAAWPLQTTNSSPQLAVAVVFCSFQRELARQSWSISPSPVPAHGGARGAPGAHQRLLRRARACVRHRLRLL